MAVNVTYLLGAGASFETLPLVKEVKDGDNVIRPSLARSISKLAKEYERVPGNSPTQFSDGQIQFIKKLIDDLESLGKSSDFFSSPDTYIKSLHLQKLPKKVEIAKKALSFYLTITQLLNDNVDKRYIPFFASILEQSKKEANAEIPSNIKIVTWNYDFQIELALQHFTPLLDEFYKIQNHFKIVPNIDNSVSLPNIIHLNGLAGICKTGEDDTIALFHKRNVDDKIIFLTKSLEQYGWLFEQKGRISDLLTFAWELTEKSNSRLDQAESIFKDTEILVVIGYSFPFFNREVDSRLFKSFLGNSYGPRNQKIYIQDPSIDDSQIRFLRERFNIGDFVSVTGLQSVNQFFLPPGL